MKNFLLVLLILSFNSSFGQIALDSLLVGCYSLDGNAADSSGNGNHGNVVGPTLTNGRSGMANSAYSFDGIDDYIEIPNFQNMISGDELSISMFAITDGGGKCLFMLSPDANDRCVGCAMYQNQHYFWDYGDFSNGGRLSHSGASDLQWHHYVYVISATSNFKAIYMDGMLLASSNSTLPLINKNRDLYIGAGSDQSLGNIRWKGSIDDIHIYNRSLSLAEVIELYNNQRMCYEMTVGVQEIEKKSKITLSPNPVNSILHLSRIDNEETTMLVYNMEGQKVYQMQLNKMETDIDMSQLGNGLYMVHFFGDEYYEIQKIVIQR